MIVCRPRKGEKAMKTPIEKASAVRSGGSSIASRRRNAERNIRLRRFLGVRRPGAALLSITLDRGSKRRQAAALQGGAYLLKTL